MLIGPVPGEPLANQSILLVTRSHPSRDVWYANEPDIEFDPETELVRVIGNTNLLSLLINDLVK